MNNSTVDSTVESKQVLNNLRDVCPDDGYDPFYTRMMNELGVERFVHFANRARAGSDTPVALFNWMLKNPEKVR